MDDLKIGLTRPRYEHFGSWKMHDLEIIISLH